jgi:pSer/pThr/pTyr-binding forkhead associated (FHA) protein
MSLVKFPSGKLIIPDTRFDKSVFSRVDKILGNGNFQNGRLEIETQETRLTCLFHRAVPFLSGLYEDDTFSWIPLKNFPVRALQLENPICRLIETDPIRVLLSAVHFRNRPVMQASTELVDMTHVLDVLSQQGQDATVSIERENARTLLFLQKGVPACIYFGNPQDDPGEESIKDRFLLFVYSKSSSPGKLEVFDKLNIEPDPDAGTTLGFLSKAAKPPPPTVIQVYLMGRMVLQRPFMPPSMTIGREHTCELILDNLSVSRRHAILHWDRGQFLIEDLKSANGIMLNGKHVTQAPLAPGDRISLGKFELTLTKSLELGLQDSTMIIHSGKIESPGYLVGGEYSIPLRQETTIGKDPMADVRATGWGVRDIHARISPQSDGTFIIACLSKGKVSINGKKVRSSRMRFGDKLVVGRSSFYLVPQLDNEPTAG